MLAIRFQRVGRKGHAEFRIVVQDSRRTPSSGRIVAQVGHYNPHTKAVVLDKEKAATFVSNGAQPSLRVAQLLKAEGVALPAWVKLGGDKTATVKNADKLRKNQPAKEVVAEEAPAVAEEAATAVEEAPVAEETTEVVTEATTEVAA